MRRKYQQRNCQQHQSPASAKQFVKWHQKMPTGKIPTNWMHLTQTHFGTASASYSKSKSKSLKDTKEMSVIVMQTCCCREGFLSVSVSRSYSLLLPLLLALLLLVGVRSFVRSGTLFLFLFHFIWFAYHDVVERIRERTTFTFSVSCLFARLPDRPSARPPARSLTHSLAGSPLSFFYSNFRIFVIRVRIFYGMCAQPAQK